LVDCLTLNLCPSPRSVKPASTARIAIDSAHSFDYTFMTV